MGQNDQDEQGGTPSHLAAIGGHGQVIDLLITKGSEVCIENKAGQTPLQKASWAGHADIVDLLVSKGARAIEEKRR